MNNKRLLKAVVFVGFIFTIFYTVFLGIISIFTIMCLGKGNQTQKNIQEFNEYQSLKLNPLTNEASYGLITIANSLGSNEFLSYVDEEGNHVLISHFETDEYQCTGSCYCEQHSDRRNAGAGTIARGLIYLVAAVSSVLAVQIARDHFTEECQDLLSSTTCPSASIKTEIDGCFAAESRITNLIKQGELDLPEDHEIMEFRDETILDFFCKGECRGASEYFREDLQKGYSYKIKEKDELLKKYPREKIRKVCNEFRMGGIVSIYKTGKLEKDHEHAREKFRVRHLNRFCGNQGEDYTKFFEKKTWYQTDGKTQTQKSYTEKSFLRFGCHGGDSKKLRNTNIHCRKLSHEGAQKLIDESESNHNQKRADTVG